MKEELALKNVGEGDSLHSVLKALTTTYLVCNECYNLGNYPHILKAHDFEKTSLDSTLKQGGVTMQIKAEDGMIGEQNMFSQQMD